MGLTSPPYDLLTMQNTIQGKAFFIIVGAIEQGTQQ